MKFTQSRASALGALIALFVLYLVSAPVGITLEDAGLFQMVCHLGGISHPPGYPLFTSFCQTFVTIPMSRLNAGNLVSIVFALCALLVLYEIVLSLTEDKSAALLAMTLYGLSNTFWSQAIIIEVYTLAAFLFLLSFWLLLNFTKTHRLRYIYLWLVVCGLSLSNHWPLFLLSSIGSLFLLYDCRHSLFLLMRQPTIWVVGLTMFAGGLLPYVSLFLITNPEISLVGPISSYEELVGYVLRQHYSDTQSAVNLADKLSFMSWVSNESLQQLTWITSPVVAWGLFRSFTLVGRNYALSLIGVFFGSTFLLVYLIDFRYESRLLASFRPYPIIAYMSLAIWFVLGWRDFVSKLTNVSQIYKTIMLASLLLFVGSTNFQKVDRSKSNFVDEYARVVLNSLPEEAVLFLHGDVQVGPIGYLNRVEKLRPDVTLYNWNGLVFDNRLIPAQTPANTRDEVIAEFIATSARPVFSIDGRLNITSNSGLYYGYARTSNLGERFVFVPEVELFIESLLASYLGEEIRDTHEQVFAQQLIRAYARLYADFSVNYGSEQLSDAQRVRFAKMQKTFHGKLGTLEALLLSRSVERFDSKHILSLIIAAESQLDDRYAKESVATLYQYHADTLKLMSYPTNREEVMSRYLDSIKAMPTQSNPSTCKFFIVATELEQQTAGYLPDFFRKCR